jgi:hypothetical protein
VIGVGSRGSLIGKTKSEEDKMTESEIAEFRFGYHECRAVILADLKEIVVKKTAADLRAALAKLIFDLDADIEREHWDAIQKEFPGMTRDEYEAECEANAEQICKTYYSEHGYLKPRLVR